MRLGRDGGRGEEKEMVAADEDEEEVVGREREKRLEVEVSIELGILDFCLPFFFGLVHHPLPFLGLRPHYVWYSQYTGLYGLDKLVTCVWGGSGGGLGRLGEVGRGRGWVERKSHGCFLFLFCLCMCVLDFGLTMHVCVDWICEAREEQGVL